MWTWLRAWFRAPATADDNAASEADDLDDFDQGEAVIMPIGPELDLHGFNPKETRDAVGDYLEAAHDEGLREVRIAHGRGRGVQKQITRSVLDSHPLVASYRDDGSNWGATIVQLISGAGGSR